MFGLLLALSSTVFGAKLILIGALGSPMPLLDQWDGEAARLYGPYLRGALSVADLFAPHNDHRIFCTRALALVHLELAGEWNTRLEMLLGAIIHTALITWFAALLTPLVKPRCRLLFVCFVAFLFAVPVGYENTLWGFQSQIYFALLFGIAALAAFAAAGPFSLRWFGGLIAATFSSLSFATGVAAIVAASVLVSVQLATSSRKRCGREFAALAALAAVAVATVLIEASSAVSKATPWTFIQGVLVLAIPTVVGLVAAALLGKRTIARRVPVPDRAWFAVGVVGWLAMQLTIYWLPIAAEPPPRSDTWTSSCSSTRWLWRRCF